MYVNINLLPPEIKLQWELKQKQQKLVAAGSLAGIVLLLVFGILLVATWQARGDAAELAKEREALLKKFPDLEQYADLQARVDHGQEILKQAMGAPPDWVGILYDLGQYMPPGVWLADFTAAYRQGTAKAATQPVGQAAESKPAGNKAADTGAKISSVLGMNPGQNEEAPLDGEVVITGYAVDRLAAAEMLNNIRKVKGLTGASCRVLSQEDLDGEIVVRFEIKAKLLPGLSVPAAGGTAVVNQ
ncbi:PilN domain-containing protein [Desulfotruncus alcoholivorax]|uniref:PilN domain-containing protein n=1 Tax=Desulfotruncus alcoholivorax TaxID=265477 RepID=UPI000409A529|nr:PilN domain-containing protein [Desulfotruncus alcoholivorax]